MESSLVCVLLCLLINTERKKSQTCDKYPDKYAFNSRIQRQWNVCIELC